MLATEKGAFTAELGYREMGKPNFLFVMTDQQRADWLGCYGHPVVKTPNIDALAAGGTRFDNFHVASPVCMPNRASFMTGRFPSLHGLRYNGCKLPLSANTFVDVLAAGGYDTASFGKIHLQPFLSNPAIRPEDPLDRLIAEAWKPTDGDYTLEQSEHYQGSDRFDFRTPYYGFQHIDMVTGHGDRCEGHYEQWFKREVKDWAPYWDPANELLHNYTCPQAYRTPIPEEYYTTTYVTDRAIEYLKDAARQDNPFFAFVSFPDPHHPFNPPGRYWDMYSPEQFEVALPYDAHKNPPPALRWLYDNWQKGGGQVTRQTAFMASSEHCREAMALTAGMISFIDDSVGRLTAALADTGLAENTVICFSSDHGDYLGDFNLLLKGALQFKSTTRVPFIWLDPQMDQEAATDALASTVDVPLSILERAGLAPYVGTQGQSFVSTLRTGRDCQSELLIEFNDLTARCGFEKPARVRSIVTKKWRYSLYAGLSWGELYDLESDPDETHNRWGEAGFLFRQAHLAERLNHLLARQMDECPLAERQA